VSLELGYVTNEQHPFKYAAHTRVGFSDTDAQGIVYYGRYFPYFDLARVEYHRHLALTTAQLAGNEFVMRAMSVDYQAPAAFDDLIEIFVRLARVGRTSATYEFAAYRADDDVLMATATQTLVLIDLEERKACPIPEAFIETVRAFEGEDLQVAAPR
jgi:acyl-CoA thioester hydrolase